MFNVINGTISAQQYFYSIVLLFANIIITTISHFLVRHISTCIGRLQVNVKRNEVVWLFIVLCMTAVGDDVCVPPCVACSVSAYLGLCLFLPLYDYAIRNRIFGDGVVVVQVVVLFAEVMYVEFPHGVYMFVMCVMFIVFSVVPCAWFSRRGGGGGLTPWICVHLVKVFWR